MERAAGARGHEPAVGSPVLLYLYAILAAQDTVAAALEADPVAGVERAPVHLLTEGELMAAVSEVPAAEYDEEPLNRQIGDLAWLAPRAAAHQAVNARLFELSEAMLPLPFATLFRRPQAVQALLRQRREEFWEGLSQVRGRAEWVVTLTADPAAVEAALESSSAALGEVRRAMVTGGPGRAYLLKRRLEEVRREEQRRSDAQAVDTLLTSLEQVAERTHREPVASLATLGAEVAGAGGAGAAPRAPEAAQRPLARLSLLVRRADEAGLRDSLARLNAAWAGRGYQVHGTGPWPCYRFGGRQLRP